MKSYEEFKSTVYHALESSHIIPEEIVEHDAGITVSMSNDEEMPEYLRNLSNILVAQHLRFKSSVSIPSHIQTISISIFNR
ncbi:hypothetical protein [Emticicia sp. C21]|uniref:hypothetical protein n=1 Tax=Emticicia sp. C21 TaxID=2302915 RepID=UPI000E355A8B|nr:hypothetical protein [Emticicia sp. C21]RFS17703.1 hypothetical protein D0T08_00150 [Emticicia sp. C21]